MAASPPVQDGLPRGTEEDRSFNCAFPSLELVTEPSLSQEGRRGGQIFPQYSKWKSAEMGKRWMSTAFIFILNRSHKARREWEGVSGQRYPPFCCEGSQAPTLTVRREWI